MHTYINRYIYLHFENKTSIKVGNEIESSLQNILQYCSDVNFFIILSKFLEKIIKTIKLK